MKPTISVIGLGKLGAPLLATIASRGFKVIGIDLNQSFVDSLNAKKANVIEPELQDYLSKYANNYSVTTDYQTAVSNSDISFIIVPTPSNKSGEFSTKFTEIAVEEIGKVLKQKKQYHLVVLVSTVLPKSTQEAILPKLEKSSGKKSGRDFGLCYNPEFIALGSVIRNLLNPDFVLIGESDKKAGDILEAFYHSFCLNQPPISRTDIINAEIVKISLNSYITTKITFANSLANLCERIPGANVDAVTNIIGLDRRISPYYLTGGSSFGGTCFPRDTRAYIALAKKYQVNSDLIITVDSLNFFQIRHLFNLILNNLSGSNTTVSILGTAFKPNTPVIEESAAVKLIPELLRWKIKVIVYDSHALENTHQLFKNKIMYASSPEECILAGSVAVFLTQDDKYKNISPKIFTKNITIIDCWRQIKYKKLESQIHYIGLGIGPKVND
jgi:UDPglucose 6-dehydrogenase